MSSRNLTVKTIKHNNNNHHSSSFVASSKSSPTVSKYQKNHSHTNNSNSIQQPKKNNNQKLQATNKNSKNNHGRNNKQNNNKKVVIPIEDDNSSTSSSSSSSSEEESSPRQNQKTMRKNYVKQQQFEYKSFVDQVYAGPTFNNAPLPSALPIPAFNARGSPINYHPQPLYSVNNPSLQQQSMDLMNLITPQKVVTAYELEKTNLALSEIQRGLRSMLKIES